MKTLIFITLLLSSAMAFAGNKFPGECADVCKGKTLNDHARSEIWQIVKNVALFEHPGLTHITTSTPASLTFLGDNLGLKLEGEEARVRDTESDKCYFMDNTVAMEGARQQEAKSLYTAGTMYNALVNIVASRRCQ